jgi:tetratricopeptide (TPR) repeat protein
MPNDRNERYDFFLSRRGSVAVVAREVADLLTEKGYRVLVQDYDIPISASFIEAMHEAVKNSRDLIILFTRDYEQSPYTRKEFTSFEAERAQNPQERYIIVLRCEDAPLRGLLADNVYQDLVDITDPEERKRRIIAAAERHSQAQAPPPRPFIGVPLRIASFTGREAELDRLDAILMRNKPAAVTQSVRRAAIQGLGGVGKTSIAAEYAHRYRSLYGGVCWCPAETRAGIFGALAELGTSLGAAAANDADVEKAAKATLRRLAEQRAEWLLIYDNVTSPDEIVDLMPAAGAKVLITSRFSDWSGLAEEISLDVMLPEEALDFLQHRANRDDPLGAKALAQALGFLPLALDHAAAYCKRRQMRFTDYADQAATLITNLPRGVGYPVSVAATFDIAIGEAVAHCNSAETVMAYVALCAPERIPMTLLDGVTGTDEERSEALAVLAELSLTRNDPFADGTPAFIVHRLVQAAAAARSRERSKEGEAIEALLYRLAKIFPQTSDAYSNPWCWSLCAKLIPHFIRISERSDEELTKIVDWAALLNRAGSYFHARESYSEGAVFFRRALAIGEKKRGRNHPSTATSINNLASLLHGKGDLSEARELMMRALAIDEKTSGPRHPNTAASLHNLGRVLHDQGCLREARPYLEGAKAIYEEAMGECPELAASLHSLADLSRDEGDFTQAKSLIEKALAIRTRLYNVDHTDTAKSLVCLADIQYHLNDFGAARSNLEYARQVHERTLGFQHSTTNRANCYLARSMLKDGEPEQAFTLSSTALAHHESALGSNHPWTKDSAHITARALDALGRTAEAAALRQRYGGASRQEV